MASDEEKETRKHSLQLDGFEFTKRNVLRQTATIYDPLVFLSSYVIRSKLLIPKAWLKAWDWDERLPTHHYNHYIARKDKVVSRIGRPWTCTKTQGVWKTQVLLKVEERSIHTFSDASENAYTAVVYAHHVYEGGNITAQLIMLKSTLAPLKVVSIPWLELLGALIGLQLLTRQVCSTLKIAIMEWPIGWTVWMWGTGSKVRVESISSS